MIGILKAAIAECLRWLADKIDPERPEDYKVGGTDPDDD